MELVVILGVTVLVCNIAGQRVRIASQRSSANRGTTARPTSGKRPGPTDAGESRFLLTQTSSR